MTKSVHSSFTHMSILHRSSWNSKKKNSRRRKIWMPRGKGVAGATYSMAAILLTKISIHFCKSHNAMSNEYLQDKLLGKRCIRQGLNYQRQMLLSGLVILLCVL
ncbi:uncharacterized protein LOC110433377 isoform X1 [Sorghum bicolor]|uniref:uncharacterized protein LOC110433377 isoform X1 n=2 Tax=Sorghum bicolor TaxID=4558 RepID=UPI000B4259FE|nr:uncharacterized protein LOC110433377 isoform X1 [Sorghum bicolor]|eukprot:XP_021311007.1 uncharacterized protein LOC110433377 isoform X1 [Sorghum bicolor]